MRVRMIYAEESHAALYTQDSDTCVVLLPGFGYSFERPLLQAASENSMARVKIAASAFFIIASSFYCVCYISGVMSSSVRLVTSSSRSSHQLLL